MGIGKTGFQAVIVHFGIRSNFHIEVVIDMFYFTWSHYLPTIRKLIVQKENWLLQIAYWCGSEESWTYNKLAERGRKMSVTTNNEHTCGMATCVKSVT